MHAKYSSTTRILFSIVLCAGLVFSGEISRKPDEKVVVEVAEITVKSVSEYPSEYGSKHPKFLLTNNTLSTKNYATSEAPTSSSNRGAVIEDTSLISPNEGPVGYNEYNNLLDTATIETVSSEKVGHFGETDEFSNNEDGKKYISSVTATAGGFTSSTPKGYEQEVSETTSIDVFQSSTRTEIVSKNGTINTEFLPTYNKKLAEKKDEMKLNQISTFSPEKNIYDNEDKTSTTDLTGSDETTLFDTTSTNHLKSSTPTEIVSENEKLNNEFLATYNKELAEKKDEMKLNRISTFPPEKNVYYNENPTSTTDITSSDETTLFDTTSTNPLKSSTRNEIVSENETLNTEFLATYNKKLVEKKDEMKLNRISTFPPEKNVYYNENPTSTTDITSSDETTLFDTTSTNPLKSSTRTEIVSENETLNTEFLATYDKKLVEKKEEMKLNQISTFSPEKNVYDNEDQTSSSDITGSDETTLFDTTSTNPLKSSTRTEIVSKNKAMNTEFLPTYNKKLAEKKEEMQLNRISTFSPEKNVYHNNDKTSTTDITGSDETTLFDTTSTNPLKSSTRTEIVSENGKFNNEFLASYNEELAENEDEMKLNQISTFSPEKNVYDNEDQTSSTDITGSDKTTLFDTTSTNPLKSSTRTEIIYENEKFKNEYLATYNKELAEKKEEMKLNRISTFPPGKNVYDDEYQTSTTDITETSLHNVPTENPTTETNSYSFNLNAQDGGINTISSTLFDKHTQNFTSEISTKFSSSTSIPFLTNYSDSENLTRDVSSEWDYSSPDISHVDYLPYDSSSYPHIPVKIDGEMKNIYGSTVPYNDSNLYTSTIPNDYSREDSETASIETPISVKNHEKNVPNEYDILDSSTESGVIPEETYSQDVTFTSSDSPTTGIKNMENINIYSPLHHTFEPDLVNVDVTAAYTKSTVYPTNNYIDKDMVTSSKHGEPYDDSKATTNNFKDLFGHQSSTQENTKPSGYGTTKESPESSTMTGEYSQITNYPINIFNKEETLSNTSRNSSEVDGETTTERVHITSTMTERKTSGGLKFSSSISPTTTNPQSDDKPTNYPNQDITTAYTELQTNVDTKVANYWLFPDWTTTTPDSLNVTDTSFVDMEKTSEITKTSSDVPYTESMINESTTTDGGHIPSSCDDTEISISHEITEIGKTYIEVTWTLSPNDIICPLEINLSCNSTDDIIDWIVTHQFTSTNVNGSEAVSYLQNLSEYTNYSCIGQLLRKTEDEAVLSTETFNVKTKAEVPSNISFSITDITAKSFFLSWQRPIIPGNLQKYYILIQKKSLHHIRDNCTSASIGEAISFFDGQKKIQYSFKNAEPNHLYEVQILAEDEAGNSTGIKQEILTNSSRSTEPLNVTSKVLQHTNNCNGDIYNATLQLEWELPCNSNGELLRFEVHITEIISSDKGFLHAASNTSYEVEINSDITNLKYELIVQNLNASCSYNVTIAAITENNLYGLPISQMTELTRDGCPSEPNITSFNSHNSSSFSLSWDEPEEYFGKIINYNVIITESGPNHKLPEDPTCEKHRKVRLNETTNSTYFDFQDGLPNFIYTFVIEARTSAGIGKPSKIGKIITQTKESEPIRNLEITKISQKITDKDYEYKIRITFEEPCNTNGNFMYYSLRKEERKNDYQKVFPSIRLNETCYDVILEKPEFHYEFEISVLTEKGDWSPGVKKNITTSAAIPKLDEKKIQCSIDEDSPTEIKVEIEKGIFSDESGNITHYAIYLFEGVDENSISQKPSFGICDEACPVVDKTFPFFTAATSHQVMSGNWNPFTGGKHQVTLSIGERGNCSMNCQPLSENTNYIVLLRGSTKTTYRDVFVFVKTGINSSSSGYFFILFIILAVIVILGIFLYIKRERYMTISFRSLPNASEEAISRHVVAVKHFRTYYTKTQNDPTILRKQYEQIEDEIKIYKEQNVHTTFALKPENKRKNRYTNILPYDEYRVRLKMDEDDEISSDYINASYIRGPTGEVEYIATQGPLEHTCKDFWKMVIQENVTVIVMVSQFVEKEKEKCFKYFPNNHENMMICEDLEVKCLTELQFDTHCIRTLLIRKDLKQFSVIHMQYLDWPDFGCPSGTYNMLSFCQEVRDRIQIEKGLMAVHCSAGVGRTGTLISLDILLQTMQKKREISIFECVMDLRKQRTHMVQTEKQYVYIHTCLNDVLENLSLYSFDEIKKDDEHIYINVNEKKRAIKGSQCEEKESAF